MKTGDRVIIKNMPDNRFADLSRLISIHELEQHPELKDYEFVNEFGFVIDGYEDFRTDKTLTGGFSGYVPYKDDIFSCSGSGQSCKKEDLIFLKTAAAPFWKFKDGVKRAFNGIIYFEEMDYYTINYEQLS